MKCCENFLGAHQGKSEMAQMTALGQLAQISSISAMRVFRLLRSLRDGETSLPADPAAMALGLTKSTDTN